MQAALHDGQTMCNRLNRSGPSLRGKAGRRAIQAAVAILLLLAPHLPSVAEALKLSSINDDGGHLGLGLVRAVEVVRGRYDRAWALVSTPEPSAADLDMALELLQANAEQWESLEPAVKLWTQRELNDKSSEPDTAAKKSSDSRRDQSSSRSSNDTRKQMKNQNEEPKSSSRTTTVDAQDTSGEPGASGISKTTSRIYDEAASLLAHNRAVLGQALARSGHTDRAIEQLEVACPEILEYQQNAEGRRDNKSWLHCYANLAEMYKMQKRFEEVSSLLARMPLLSEDTSRASTSATGNDSSYASDVVETPNREPAIPAAASRDDDDNGESEMPGVLDDSNSTQSRPAAAREMPPASESSDGPAAAARSAETRGNGTDSASDSSKSTSGSEVDEEEEGRANVGVATTDVDAAETNTADRSGKSTGRGAGRSDASPSRGAGAARVAGLNKAAAAASAAASAESAATVIPAVETSVEADARRLVERHAEAMRASMNELAGELAVTTATRPMASQEWLDSRVAAAEEVLAAVRAGLLPGTSASDSSQSGEGKASSMGSASDLSVLAVGMPGHADILREASHYLSAIKGVAGRGWSYVDNELQRMERHPSPSAKPGFQSRREVIHTFRYLLIKARQYASENQTQATAAASSSQMSGRSRRKDRGRKASSNPNAARKGRSSATARSSSKSSSQGGADNDTLASDKSTGFLTLFAGMALTLLAAAFSSGARSGGPGRRREVVRQRAATRAAKTVGSYVEPPQRGALAAVLAQVWINLKRSGVLISSHATSHALFARKACAAAFADALDRVRNARDVKFGLAIISIITGKRLTPAVAAKKRSNTAPPQLQRQRSRKQTKKGGGAPAAVAGPVLSRTMTGTPPLSPRGLTPTVEAMLDAAARGNKSVAQGTDSKDNDVAVVWTTDAFRGVEPAGATRPGGESESRGSVTRDTAVAPRESGIPSMVDTMVTGAKVSKDAIPVSTNISEQSSASDSTVGPASEAREAVVAVTTAGEATAGSPFPDVMTAEQVQAMVEEDERAWEQARQSGRKQHRNATLETDAIAAVRENCDVVGSLGGRGSERDPNEPEDGGWSEVGPGGCSRPRGNGGGGSGGARSSNGGGGGGNDGGKVLSMRNVRAAAAARARSSSPGSDPVTTTSASSSECSDASKENVNRTTGSRNKLGRRVGANRTLHVAGKDTATPYAKHSSRSLQHSVHRHGNGANGTGSGRTPRAAHQAREVTAPSRTDVRDSDHTASSRLSRVSYIPWAAASTKATAGRNTQESRNTPRPTIARKSISTSPVYRGEGRSQLNCAAEPSEAAKAPTRSKPQPPVRAASAPVAATAPASQDEDTKVKVVHETRSESAPVAASEAAPPVAWTNTAAHPLGVQPEPTSPPPVPAQAPTPTREMSSPSPDHQQHWQRQHQQEQQAQVQQQQQQQQHHQHFFYHSEPLPMPSAATTSTAQHGHYYPPPPLLPPHQQHLSPLSRDMMVPQFLPVPVADEYFPPHSMHLSGASNGGGAGPTAAMLYGHRSLPVGSSSPTVSPGGVGVTRPSASVESQYHFRRRDGSCKSHSPGSNGGCGGSGFSPGEAAILAPPPQLMMGPPTSHDQSLQRGRFSPSIPLMQPTAEEMAAAGEIPSMYGQPAHVQAPLPPPNSGLHPSTSGVGVASTGGDVAGDGGALEALIGAIRWQVEYYFSVENLVKDVYLRNLMDGEGFVAVSKIIVFNRVRSMTRDMSLLVEAMRRSTELELREQEHTGEVMVRTRHSPLHWVNPHVRATNEGSQQQAAACVGAYAAETGQHYPYEEGQQHQAVTGVGEPFAQHVAEHDYSNGEQQFYYQENQYSHGGEALPSSNEECVFSDEVREGEHVSAHPEDEYVRQGHKEQYNQPPPQDGENSAASENQQSSNDGDQ